MGDPNCRQRREALGALQDFVPKLGAGHPDENVIAMDVVRAAIRHAQFVGVTAEQIRTLVEGEVAP